MNMHNLNVLILHHEIEITKLEIDEFGPSLYRIERERENFF